MNIKIKSVFIFLGSLSTLLALFSCGNAQRKPTEAIYQKVFPGDEIVNADRIKPHKVKYEKSGGKMLYDLQKVEKDGKEIYRMQIYFNSDPSTNKTPDTMYFDTKTLAFMGRRLTASAYTVDVKFSDGKFTGGLIPAKDSKYKPFKYDKAYSHTMFEPAIINYFIAALPLKVGYKASIPTIDLNNGSEIWWANIEVLGREKVNANGKTYDTWKVLSKGVREKTIWISTTKPYAVKMETKGNLGSWLVNDSVNKKSSKNSSAKSVNSNNSNDPLAFFAGTWKRDGMEGFEKWERKGGMEFVGKGYKKADGKEKITERMEIKTIDGKVFFVATLLEQGDGQPINLAFTGMNENEFSFENPKSNVIRKIVYKKMSDTELVVQLMDAGGNQLSYKLNKQ